MGIHLATHGFFADAKFRSVLGPTPDSDWLFGGSEELVVVVVLLGQLLELGSEHLVVRARRGLLGSRGGGAHRE